MDICDIMSHNCLGKLCQQIYMKPGQPHQLTTDSIFGPYHIFWNCQSVRSWDTNVLTLTIVTCHSEHTYIIGCVCVYYHVNENCVSHTCWVGD